jgi:hypothetical protein
MRNLSAVDDPGACTAYIAARRPPGPGAARSRANCEHLWRDFWPLADAQFMEDFRSQFHQRWFEMYLAVALLRTGLEVRYPGGGAPDIQVQHKDGRVVWLEATAPTGGDPNASDSVVEPPRPGPGEPGVAFHVPTEAVILRITGALGAKARQIQGYRDKKIVDPDDEVLVAVNVNGVPHGATNAESCALGALYGVGSQFVTLDRETGEVVESGYQHRPQLRRASGSPVDAAPFLAGTLAHIAGALVSSTNSASCPTPLGLDFMLFPNLKATPAYTARQLPLGREWRWELESDGSHYELAEVIDHSRAAA